MRVGKSGIRLDNLAEIDDWAEQTRKLAGMATMTTTQRVRLRVEPFEERVVPTSAMDASWTLEIAGVIWRDLDGDGRRSSAEPTIADTKIDLLRGGRIVGSTQTDAQGRYAFHRWNVHHGTILPDDDGLTPETDYQIRIALAQDALRGLLPTLANQGDDAGDSDATAGDGVAVILVRTGRAGAAAPLDAGFAPALSIGNQVWNDLNNNGRKDAHETGLGGVLVRLLRSSDHTEIARQTTAADGTYGFHGLLPGSYLVEVAASNFDLGGPLAGFISSTGWPGQRVGPFEGPTVPNPARSLRDGDDNGTTVGAAVRTQPFDLRPTGTAAFAVDFGLVRSTTVAGRVFLDVNENGRLDPGESTGFGGVLIRLAGSQGIITTVTDAEGRYRFEALPVGNYTVLPPPSARGYRATSNGPVLISSQAGEIRQVDFGRAPVVDLAVRSSASAPIIQPGESFLLTFRVRNIGTRPATGVVLTIPLPDGLQFVRSESGPAYSPVTKQTSIGNLAPGQDMIVRMRVKVLAAGLFQIRASVKAEEAEPAMGNNSTGVTVTAAVAPPTKPTWNWLIGSTYR